MTDMEWTSCPCLKCQIRRQLHEWHMATAKELAEDEDAPGAITRAFVHACAETAGMLTGVGTKPGWENHTRKEFVDAFDTVAAIWRERALAAEAAGATLQ